MTAVENDDNQVCLVYYLREGAEAEYDRLHAAVWPEILAELRDAGFYDYSIFRRGPLVISVYRTSPTGPTSTNASTSEAQSRWAAVMADLFETSVDARGAELTAKRIFRLE